VTTKGLADYTRFLRNAAPREFADFCTAFAEYTGTVCNTLIYATDNLPLAQGHAQQCAALLKVFEEVKNG
jgi:hypothetical protein